MGLWNNKKNALLQIDAAGTLICLTASLVAYFTVIAPFIEQRFLLANQRDNLAARRQESSRLGASMRMLSNQLSIVQEKLAKSQTKLESADRINQRIAELTILLTDCDLEVDDVKSGKITASPKYDVVPINLAGRGGYKQCVAFLHKLNRNFADISVVRFELEGNPANPEKLGTFSFQLFWHTIPKV